MITENKSNLARLLSEENLIVEQRKVSTAFFDGESRLLVLPTFKDELSLDITDMMISHEVGHALFTPSDSWKTAVIDTKVKHSILNVVEDARIEKKIKYKYPGLRSIYSRAYRELNDMNFFGIEEKEVNELNLIDRINLYFKVGFILGINFTEKEQEYVDMVENVQSFDDVIEVSKLIQDYMKEEFAKKPGLNDQEYDEDSDLKSGVSEDLEFDETSDKSNSNKETLNSDEIVKGSVNVEIDTNALPGEDDIEEKIEASTQEAAEISVKMLFSDSYKQSYYVDIPDYNIKDYIIDHKRLYSDLISGMTIKIEPTLFNRFKVDTNPVVSYLVKEFMLKKNADSRKKIKVSKTGDINVSKLFGYKIYDDIFKRSASVKNSKSHGLVFFLDWSASMYDYMEDTIKQLITMLLFCKKLNIPFEVYSFTTEHYEKNIKNIHDPSNHKIAMINPVKLMNIFSSRMSINEFNTACSILLKVSGEKTSLMKSIDSGVPNWFRLGNTPLNHAILLSKKIMEDFKERTKVQISNAIYLTDGESHQVKFYYEERGFVTYDCLTNSLSKVYLRDPKSRITKSMYPGEKLTYSFRKLTKIETDFCLDFVKQHCDFKMFGFRLITASQLKYHLKDSAKFDTTKLKLFKKHNCLADSDNSYDEFYYIKSNTIDTEEEFEEFGEKETVSSIAKKFTKSINNKVNNRIFLKKFIEFIS